jgi:YD repeat-containing protein
MKIFAIRATGLARVRFVVALACSLAASPALAQEQAPDRMISTPADHFAIAPGGVDMRTGRYVYDETDLSIGGEAGGLVLSRTMAAGVLGHTNPFGNLSHNWDVMIMERRININDPGNMQGLDYRMNVYFGGRSQTFEAYQSATGYMPKSQGTGWASLTFSGDKASAGVVYTFTATDGTAAMFRALGNGDCSSSIFRCAYVSEITEPDGTRLTFDYGASGASTGGAVQLRRVTSSRGYALLLEGTDNLVTKACVLNLALAPLPTNGLCPANALATATYGYVSGPARLASVTGPDGATAGFTYSGTGSTFTMGFLRPGETSPWLVNTVNLMPDEEAVVQEVVVGQSFADGQSYTYAFDQTPQAGATPSAVAGGGYQDALGHTTRIAYDWPLLHGDNPYNCTQLPCSMPAPDQFPHNYQLTPGPVEVIDALGHASHFDYCDPVPMQDLPSYEVNRCVVIPLQSFTDPEGALTELQYDGNRNITRVTRHPRPGSHLPDGSIPPNIVTAATYDVAHPRSAAKPLTRTDARGNTTEYSYSPDHGGLLTETGPAPSTGAPRPQTRHDYAQRYAWVANGSGGYQHASSTPIWVHTATSLCRTSAATGNPLAPCAAAGDEVRTAYDYGPDSGPNTLLLRGQTVTSTDNGVTTILRTCYGYDALGRRISETQPGANLGSCP